MRHTATQHRHNRTSGPGQEIRIRSYGGAQVHVGPRPTPLKYDRACSPITRVLANPQSAQDLRKAVQTHTEARIFSRAHQAVMRAVPKHL